MSTKKERERGQTLTTNGSLTAIKNIGIPLVESMNFLTCSSQTGEKAGLPEVSVPRKENSEEERGKRKKGKKKTNREPN